MTDVHDDAPAGLETTQGVAPHPDRKSTGDPSAPPSAATDTLGALAVEEADARTRQAERAERERRGEDEPEAHPS